MHFSLTLKNTSDCTKNEAGEIVRQIAFMPTSVVHCFEI